MGVRVILAFLIALVLTLDAGSITRLDHSEFEPCRYAGYCCQFDWIGKSGCRFRALCKGRREKRYRTTTYEDGRQEKTLSWTGVCK